MSFDTQDQLLGLGLIEEPIFRGWESDFLNPCPSYKYYDSYLTLLNNVIIDDSGLYK
jgi:hypothetical protein